MSLAKRAALLLAVEPRLRGILLIGPPGSGKSALLDALAGLDGGPAIVANPGIEPDQLHFRLERMVLAHHFDLLDGLVQRRCFDTGVVLAGAQEEPRQTDRFGLVVWLPSPTAEERLEVLAAERADIETELLKREVTSARRRVVDVHIDRQSLGRLADVAVALQVQGNRADYFAALAARASAALDGREEVDGCDLELAVQTVLAPRARALPDQLPTSAHETGSRSDASVEAQPGETGSAGASRLASRGQAGEVEAIPALVAGTGDGNDSLEMLLAAARCAFPAQLRPRSAEENKGSRRGRFVRALPARGRKGPIALSATIRSALPWQRLRGWRPGERPRLSRDDLRVKFLAERRATLHVIVFDASGSMASNRLAEAKGAAQELLRHAYVNRDRVAVIAFRKQSALLVLAPTRSLALARPALERLPVGGGTPLAAGLQLALRIAQAERRRSGRERIRLHLFTDGRVSRKPEDVALRREIGRLLLNLDLQTTVIDTRGRFAGSGEAQMLAGELGAGYAALGRGVMSNE